MSAALKPLLHQLGLSNKEADVYLASLRLGEASAQEIAHAARIERTTTASILERLAEEGFVSVQRRGRKRAYWIEDPHILVEKQRARLEIAEALSGQLHAEYHSADKRPTAEVFETKEAIVNLMLKIIEQAPKGGEILTFDTPSARHYQAVLSDELFHAHSRQKVKKGIRTRSLIPHGQHAEIRSEALAHNVQVRVMPNGLRFEVSLWVAGTSVVLFSGTHLFAVRITHRHMAESLRSLFQFLWNLSAPLGKD